MKWFFTAGVAQPGSAPFAGLDTRHHERRSLVRIQSPRPTTIPDRLSVRTISHDRSNDQSFEISKLVLWGKGYTRSHSEHGSKVFYHRWYSARGRVGRRQLRVFKFLQDNHHNGGFSYGLLVRLLAPTAGVQEFALGQGRIRT